MSSKLKFLTNQGKAFVIVMLFSLFLYNTELLPQELACGTTGSAPVSSQTGGIYIPSQGTLKVLVVFARFKDDATTHNWWPVPPVGDGNPVGWNTYIDLNTQTGSTHLINLTNYYKTMSMGTFNVIGQAISVETPQNRSYYGSNYFLATKEVLQQKVDPLVNFASYDNWTYNSNFIHANQADGTVDMVVMVWRCSTTPFPFGGWTGEASLGYGGSFNVENGTKTIKTDFGGGNGSGVTIHAWGQRDQKYTFHAVIHEVAHWLLGGGHPYAGSPIYNVWGMLWASSFGVCANAYEREKLAWIYPTPITGDILSAPLSDFITTGTAYKYHPPNGGNDDYYYFENHQKLNIYDDATNNPNDKGIFVIHQGGNYQSGNIIKVKPSNGHWNWENPSSTTCFGGSPVPIFKPVSVNRTGKSNRDILPKSGGGSEWLFYLANSGIAGWPTGGCGGWLHGEGLNNSFNLTNNNVFSNYSNPWVRTWTNSINNFTMEITAQNSSVVNARFYLTNPLGGKPSKPQNLRLTNGANNHPLLTLGCKHRS